MLQHSFIHIKGIGEITEKRMWEKGFRTWDDFLNNHEKCGLSDQKSRMILKNLSLSKKAFLSYDHSFFEKCFPTREKWRLFEKFRNYAVYLDIETTGLSPFYDDITVIGLFDGTEEKAFVMGDNLHEFADRISPYKMIITFNGARFDLPFIRQALNISLDQIHIDLMYPLKRLGYAGGLKKIESALGIYRTYDLKDVDGFEAVRLWYAYKRNDDKAALDKLVKYNLEDTKNLKILMEFVYNELKEKTLTCG